MIVAAAIKVNSLIMTMPQPARHHDILRQWTGVQEDVLQGNEATYIECVEGFIDDNGKFYNRRFAMDHCVACGQPLARRIALIAEGRKGLYQGDELYSEDLW